MPRPPTTSIILSSRSFNLCTSAETSTEKGTSGVYLLQDGERMLQWKQLPFPARLECITLGGEEDVYILRTRYAPLERGEG